MKEEINKNVVCVLRKNSNTKQIELDYLTIVNPFEAIIEKLSNLCDNKETTIPQIVEFIQHTKELDQLTTYYNYCVSLSDAYQTFPADNQKNITKIKEDYQLIQFNKECNPENYKFDDAVNYLKICIKEKYTLWSNAYAINKTYRLCYEDTSILTFSHRIDGWSNPIYQLTPNFSVEIKTNFGYGRASYFYTKLKYKGIEITPFSEWIKYEFAYFSEIIRYTKSHILENKYWLEAMEFARDACNLSLTDEVGFIEKYLIGECEKMVSGLEELFNKEQFTFNNYGYGKTELVVDKTGHVLVEFRGEKISGALDFISKIIEYENIIAVKSFIDRIEDCNRRIQPILIEESKILKTKIDNLNLERNELRPVYEEVNSIYNDYTTKKSQLKAEMIAKAELEKEKMDFNKFETEFTNKYPEYKEFLKFYGKVILDYRELTAKIQNNTSIRNKIIIYTEKIAKYFGVKQTLIDKQLLPIE